MSATLSWFDIAVRLTLGIVAGFLVGLDRGEHAHPPVVCNRRYNGAYPEGSASPVRELAAQRGTAGGMAGYRPRRFGLSAGGGRLVA